MSHRVIPLQIAESSASEPEHEDEHPESEPEPPKAAVRPSNLLAPNANNAWPDLPVSLQLTT